MLDSKVIKTQFGIDWVCTCHILVISCYIPIIAWYILSCTSHILNRFSLPLGKSWILGSDWKHIPNILHGFRDSEFDKSLFRQWLALNGYVQVYLKDVTRYTANIPVYTRYIYCPTPPFLWIRLCRPCDRDADGSQPHAPCLPRPLRPASRMSS